MMFSKPSWLRLTASKLRCGSLTTCLESSLESSTVEGQDLIAIHELVRPFGEGFCIIADTLPACAGGHVLPGSQIFDPELDDAVVVNDGVAKGLDLCLEGGCLVDLQINENQSLEKNRVLRGKVQTYEVDFGHVLGELRAVKGEDNVAPCPVVIEVLTCNIVEFADEGAELVVLALVDLVIVRMLWQRRTSQLVGTRRGADGA